VSENFLANENFPAATVAWLRRQGHDVLHAAETRVGASDAELLSAANDDGRIVLTFDRDFGELVFHQRKSPACGIVLFRLRDQSPEVILPFLQSFFESEPDLNGFFTVASPGQFRQTPLTS